MTTLYTHAVAGLGIARLGAVRPMPWSYWALAVILPLLPDLDVFSTAPYNSPLGHRGVTHSLLFAMAAGLIAARIVARPFRRQWWMLAGLYFAVVASHGLLDALTRGGEGIPFFWPLGDRYGNWGPIPVSDIAFDWPDPRSSRAIRSELLWVWGPMALAVILATAYRRTIVFRRRTGQPPQNASVGRLVRCTPATRSRRDSATSLYIKTYANSLPTRLTSGPRLINNMLYY